MRQIIETPKAPCPIGPYSQAVRMDALVFVSGQIPVIAETGGVVAGGIGEQTHQVMKNLAAILEAAGSGMENVVKTTVFLADLNDFAAMNRVYDEYLGKVKPARSTVEVARLPKEVLLEIEAIATV